MLATLHTNSAAESINRIIDVFPSNQQSQVRAQLAFVLEGVMTQTLLQKGDFARVIEPLEKGLALSDQHQTHMGKGRQIT